MIEKHSIFYFVLKSKDKKICSHSGKKLEEAQQTIALWRNNPCVRDLTYKPTGVLSGLPLYCKFVMK